MGEFLIANQTAMKNLLIVAVIALGAVGGVVMIGQTQSAEACSGNFVQYTWWNGMGWDTACAPVNNPTWQSSSATAVSYPTYYGSTNYSYASSYPASSYSYSYSSAYPTYWYNYSYPYMPYMYGGYGYTCNGGYCWQSYWW